MLRKTLTVMTLLLSASMAAQAAPCSAELAGNDAMKFDKANIEVPKSCKEFTIKLSHSGKLATNVMGHNVVIAKTTDIAGVATDGMAAGLAANYVKPGDARVVAHSKVIGGGQTTTVTFPVAKITGAPYSFFCTFPGHWAMMKGTLTVK